MARHVGRGADQQPEAGVEASLQLGDGRAPAALAAASSRASGMPSRRRQTWPMRRRSSSVGSNPGRASAARSRKSCTASASKLTASSSGTGSGSPRRPPRRRGRAVPGRWPSPHRPPGLEDLLGEQRSVAEDVLAVVQHQQHLGAAEAVTDGVGQQAGLLLLDADAAATAAATPSVEGTSEGLTSARPTSQTPSAWWRTRAAAASTASLVLPQPPGPTRVTRRRWSSRSPIWATAFTRPTKLETGSGRLLGCSPIVFSGGNSRSRPSAWTWKRRTGSGTSRSSWRPRSMSSTSSGSEPEATTASDTTTWPPWAAAMMRAQRLGVGPR